MAAENAGIIQINYVLFWQIVNFAVLVWVFKKFFTKPIGNIIKQRQKKIAEDIENAKTSNEKAAQYKLETEKEFKAAKEEVQNMLSDAVRKADDIKDGILKEAHSVREKMLKSAESDIIKMKEQVKRELREEMTGIAIQLAEKMINETMDNKKSEKLLNEFIDKVGE